MFLFTRELGLVGAHAQSSRQTKSKLRYALDDLSFSKVSLVRGKNTWRLTNAVFQQNFFTTFREDRAKLVVCANVLKLIQKLVAGEEKNEKLFEIVERGFSFLLENTLSEEGVHNTEAIFVLRILDNLGYFGGSEALSGFVASDAWSLEMIKEMSVQRKNAIYVINKSLEASHL